MTIVVGSLGLTEADIYAAAANSHFVRLPDLRCPPMLRTTAEVRFGEAASRRSRTQPRSAKGRSSPLTMSRGPFPQGFIQPPWPHQW